MLKSPVIEQVGRAAASSTAVAALDVTYSMYFPHRPSSAFYFLFSQFQSITVRLTLLYGSMTLRPLHVVISFSFQKVSQLEVSDVSSL